MRRLAGQAGRFANRVVRLVLGVAMLTGLGLAALAWRLQEGPLPVPLLAREVENAFNAGRDGTRLEIGSVAIAWSGWRDGQRSPLALTLRQVRAIAADGAMLADLPDAAVSLSLPWLLRGVFAPSTLELRGLTLAAERAQDGTLHLDLGAMPGGAAAAEPGADPILDLATQLMRPPSDNAPLAALRSVQLSEARLRVVDAQFGRSWTAEIGTLTLRRRDRGGIDLTGQGALVLETGQVGLRLRGSIDGATGRGSVTLSVPAVRPAALAGSSPRLAPLRAIDAVASLAVDVQLDGLRIPTMALARLRVGPGTIVAGGAGRITLRSLEADLTLDGDMVRLERAVIRPGPSGMGGLVSVPPPQITMRAEARLTEGRWQAEAHVGIDRVAVADLGHYWPAGIAAGARSWITENMTGGIARDGTWRATASWDPEGSAPRLLSFEGTLEAEDLEVHWLRPMPPAQGVDGRARFALDAIDIDIAAGRQSGTSIDVREGRVRIGLATDPETAELDFVAGGPAAEVWALLRHDRLGLFSRRPPPITEVRGTLREARVLLAFPLISELPIEAMRISATGRVSDIRIPRLVLGKDLERGNFEFSVDPNGLRANGTATVQGIALRVQQEADFRPGPPGQVVSREIVSGRADARQIATFGLDPRPIVEGMVGLDIRNETRRNGQGRVAVRTDLTQARIALDALAWSKAPGVSGQGEATVILLNGQVTAIDGIRVETSDALMRGRGTQLRNNVPQLIEVQQAQIGRSRFSGEIGTPSGPRGNWRIAMRGPVLDVAPVLARPSAAEQPASAETGAEPGFALDLRFDRVLLEQNNALAGVTARLTTDARGTAQVAELRGRVEGGGTIDLSIAPAGGQRRLLLASDNGGALLRAFGVLRTIQGGRLRVDAAFEDGRRGVPLVGSAELEDFAVQDAPAFGKLLQALSVFGVFEALSGQGLTFASLTAPFSLTREAVVLNDARAFSVSLGLTAKGRIDRLRQTIDMEGTIVPAYVFNSLLGRIPGLGRLFSPERGGGLFAATYRMRGPLNDPSVSVNPLAALTPGFLRGIFGGGEASPGDAPAGR